MCSPGLISFSSPCARAGVIAVQVLVPSCMELCTAGLRRVWSAILLYSRRLSIWSYMYVSRWDCNPHREQQNYDLHSSNRRILPQHNHTLCMCLSCKSDICAVNWNTVSIHCHVQIRKYVHTPLRVPLLLRRPRWSAKARKQGKREHGDKVFSLFYLHILFCSYAISGSFCSDCSDAMRAASSELSLRGCTPSASALCHFSFV